MTQPLLGTVDGNGFVWTVPRQNFVKLYVATGDAKAAARDAKLPEEDDPKTLLKDPSIVAAIDELHAQVLRRIHESQDTVLSRYSNLAEANIFDYVEAGDLDHDGYVRLGNVKLRDWRKMPRHMQQRVKKFKVHTTGNAAGNTTNFEIELHDPMKANDMLAKILGLGGGEDGTASDFAEAIHAFLKEANELDEHYEEPDGDG